MHTAPQPSEGFEATSLSSEVLSAVRAAGLITPTPIQAQAIPVAVDGRDLIGIAQTGTGKTMAFGLPSIQAILQRKVHKALILVPTRELALQVEESLRRITKHLAQPPRTISLIGGVPIYRQIRELKARPSILIATPGRLRDHLDQKTVNLENVGILVLDEADRMLDMGFAPQINYICAALPTKRQTMLFSATMAPEIATLAHTYLADPVRIEIAKAGSSNANIEQELCYVGKDEKLPLLERLLGEHSGTVLVFSRTKHGASKLTKKVQGMGHSAAEIHSDRSLGQRRQALEGFKSGRYRVLVATDVASRGIDVPDISVVINFDLPDAAEDYVHRIGRTGRAERQGKAISLATPDQHKDVRIIERLLGKELPLSGHSEEKPAAARASAAPQTRRPAERRFSGNGSEGGYGHKKRSSSFRPKKQRTFFYAKSSPYVR